MGSIAAAYILVGRCATDRGLGSARGLQAFHNHGDHRNQNDQQYHLLQVLLHDRDTAQQIAEHGHAEHPSDPTEYVEGNEAGVVHPSYTGDEGSERTDDGHESRVDDGLAAVLFVEGVGAVQMLAAKPAGIRTAEDGWSGAPAQRISERIASQTRGP